MRTERKVDPIVFDWLREGLVERLAELLRALEQLSEGENVTEHVFDASQALQTLDRVFAMVDIQLVRVLIRTQLAALENVERNEAEDEAAVSAQIEAAALIRSLLDHMSTGSRINAASLLPMVNRLREGLGQPPFGVQGLAARAFVLQAEHETGKLPQSSDEPGEQQLRPRLRRMERAVLSVMRNDWATLPGLRELSMQIVGSEPRRSAVVAVRLFDELARLTEEDPGRYAPLLKRAVGRVLQLFRLQLSGRSETVIDHAALELGATILTSLLDRIDDDTGIWDKPAGEWKARLARAEQAGRFLGLDADALKAVAEALEDELLVTQDVLDLFVRGKRDDLEPINRIRSRFQQMSGVLRTLGYESASVALDEGRERLQAVISGSALLDDALLMDLAGTVMLVEQVVAGIPRRLGEKVSVLPLRDQTVVESIPAIATAAYENLASAREKVNLGLAGNTVEAGAPEANPFEQAAGTLAGIGEVLRFARLDAALPLIDALARWAGRQEFGAPVGDEHTLSALSEIFAALEFYLENLRDFRKEIVRFLDGAIRRTEDLLATPEAPEPRETGREAVTAEAERPEDEAIASEGLSVEDERDNLLEFWQVDTEEEPLESLPSAATEPGRDEESGAPALAGDEAVRRHEPVEGASEQAGEKPQVSPEAAAPEQPLQDRTLGEAETIAAAEGMAGPVTTEEDQLPELPEIEAASAEGRPVSEEIPDLELPEQTTEPVPEEAERAEEAPPETPDADLDLTLPEQVAAEEPSAGEAPAVSAREPASAVPEASVPPAHDADVAPAEQVEEEDPMLAEMREVFAEEMGETLPEMIEAASEWRSHSDGDALVRLRRGFHTIKGSGRMVGLDAIGEWAWSWERLLNGVIDGNIEPTAAIREGAAEAAARMQAVLPQLEAGHAIPDSHWDASRKLAAQLESGEEPAPVGQPPVEPEAVIEAGPAASRIEPNPPEEAAQPEPAPSEARPIIVDPVLREIFDQEIGGYIRELHDKIGESREHGVGLACDNELVRLLHTTLGSARTAGVDVIATLAHYLEEWTRILAVHGESLHGDDLDLFAEGADMIGALRRWAVDPSEPLPDSHELEERLRIRFERALTHYGEATESAEARHDRSSEGPTADRPPAQASIEAGGQSVPAEKGKPVTEPEEGAAEDEFAAEAAAEEAELEGEVAEEGPLEVESPHREVRPAGLEFGEPELSPSAWASEKDASEESAAESAGEKPPAPASSAEKSEPEGKGAETDTTGRFAGMPAYEESEEWAAWATGTQPFEEVQSPAGAGEEARRPVSEAEPAGEEGAIPRVETGKWPAESGEFEAVSPETEAAEGPRQEVERGEPAVEPVAEAERRPTPGAEEPRPGVAAEQRWESEAAAVEASSEDHDIEERPDDDPTEQDEDILQIFLDEADELLEQADAYLAHWRAHPNDLESIRLLHRNLHTLKGGARMAGLLNLGDVAHHLEGRLDLARKEESEENESLVALVQYSYDVIADLLDRVRNRQPVPQQRELIALIRDPAGADRFVRQGAGKAPEPASTESSTAEPAAAQEGEAVPAEEPAPKEPEPSAQAQPEPRETAPERREEQIRVGAGSIDELVNQINESVLLQSRIDRQVNGFERQLFELQQTVTRLRSQLRRLEIETETQIKADLMEEVGVNEEDFDPLEFDRFTQVQELSRGIMESLGDVASIEETLSSATEESQLLLLQQSRLGRKMQDRVLAMRLVRFNDIVGRLRRIVRQVGEEMGRQAELVVENGETELDRVTLMALLPSLEHMIRNSIAHGIEAPEERRRLGKNPVGRLLLNVDSGGGNVTVSLRDDGRGLDLDAIRRKAVERDLIPSDVEVSDEEARSLIFLPGFSTAGNVSQVAGRGVGMDVVASATRELGGFVDIDSEQGRFTEIRLNLPLTQAMTKGVLIVNGDDRYAVPYKGVVAVTRATGVTLAELYRQERPRFEYHGEQYPLYYLGELLWGQPAAEAAQDVAAIRPILLFKLGERRFALHVDHQLGAIQLFVKSLGPQLGRIPGLAGATIADDGDVILVLELFELVQQFQRRDYQRRLSEQARRKPRRERPTVLVVDDSLTVRKVTARTLERNDYDVVLARDGVEALGVLQDKLPDLVLTDIEMPRMDGFELLGAIRNDPASADTPVVMISSRTGQKHRSRAGTLGVSAYLGKPYTEMELIETIDRLLPHSVAGSGPEAGQGHVGPTPDHDQAD
jgi:chemosensory pili system protein ChpA (sensor histidine kinase/response regulator)